MTIWLTCRAAKSSPVEFGLQLSVEIVDLVQPRQRIGRFEPARAGVAE
jgi:hypothetical protein